VPTRKVSGRNALCPYETTISSVPELFEYLFQKGDLLSWIFGDLRYVGNWTDTAAPGTPSMGCVGECMACSTTLVFLRRYIEKNIPLSDIMAQLLGGCENKGLKVAPEVCKGYLESNAVCPKLHFI
jgi:hypothetical protein